MNNYKRILLPIAIFATLAIIAFLIKANPPETERRAATVEPSLLVTTETVQRQDYRISLQSYGTVQPRTQTVLTAQVSGQIIYLNPNVRDGGFFEKGDVLASIDARDYEADVKIAEAGLMDARQLLADAEARSEQARDDWTSLGRTGEPSRLVLQLPQLEAAKARVISAEANLEKARLYLERTHVIAPYAGRVLQKSADIGQVVSINTPVAEIYATDFVEVRLPIKNNDLGFIDLPETFSDHSKQSSNSRVELISELVGSAVWDARLVRTEGAIDNAARQLHVVAQVDNPFSGTPGGPPPLKIGQYVTARITGSVLQDSLVIPNAAIYQGSYVYTSDNGVLQRREIEIAWQNETEAVIRSGLESGDRLVTTPLGQVTSGIRVTSAEPGQDARNMATHAAPGNSNTETSL